MRLLIKQRVFSWTDTYDVYDEYEHPKYFVKAEFLTIRFMYTISQETRSAW